MVTIDALSQPFYTERLVSTRLRVVEKSSLQKTDVQVFN